MGRGKKPKRPTPSRSNNLEQGVQVEETVIVFVGKCRCHQSLSQPHHSLSPSPTLGAGELRRKFRYLQKTIKPPFLCISQRANQSSALLYNVFSHAREDGLGKEIFAPFLGALAWVTRLSNPTWASLWLMMRTEALGKENTGLGGRESGLWLCGSY